MRGEKLGAAIHAEPYGLRGSAFSTVRSPNPGAAAIHIVSQPRLQSSGFYEIFIQVFFRVGMPGTAPA